MDLLARGLLWTCQRLQHEAAFVRADSNSDGEVNLADAILRAGQGSKLDIGTINDITDTYLEARYGITDAVALQHLEERVSAMR